MAGLESVSEAAALRLGGGRVAKNWAMELCVEPFTLLKSPPTVSAPSFASDNELIATRDAAVPKLTSGLNEVSAAPLGNKRPMLSQGAPARAVKLPPTMIFWSG